MSGISALNSSTPVGATNAPNRFGDLSTEEFIKIIFTELSNQDPFQPNDSSALLEQLNSIRSIESDLTLTKQLQSLVTENQLASASGMIGKFIGGLTEQNDRVAGFVVSVIRQGDEIALELDTGWLVPISGVETVIDPELLLDEPDPDEPPSTPETPSSPST